MNSFRPIRPLIAGNWKMCASRAQLAELKGINEAAACTAAEVVVCPPFPLIHAARRMARGVAVGAQDCHHETEGAYTGSVSAIMLHEVGARYVIVGHSERRALGEGDALVKAKAAAALGAGLKPIVCVGESADDRAAGRAIRVISAQLEASVPAAMAPEKIVVAYEPIWAIGSGRTPTAGEIAEVHATIRRALLRCYGPAAAMIRILYGGSVTPDNARAICAIPGVDGLLVGRCSLTARDFVPVIEAAAACPAVLNAAAA